jgi:glucosamine 6-phosphate synthetase-like amidotransferase/phosphosugar isomerase protein
MCGIAGIIRWNREPIKEETIGVLLVGNEHRGNDASGLVIQQANGDLAVLKKDIPGWQLVTSQEYETFIRDYLKPDSRSVLVHARAASQGNPRDNNNNHPMYAGCSAIVHNGVIRNDNFLFKKLGFERKAETDSDILRAILDQEGITEDGIDIIGEASGSGAIAAVHPRFKDQVLLIRSGNPMTIASNDNFFYFSSEKETLHKACRPFVLRKGMWFQAQKPDVDFSNMANHTAYVIGPQGLLRRRECKICQGDYTEPWRKTYEEYAIRQEKFNNRLRIEAHGARKEAYCDACKKMWMIPVASFYCDHQCPKPLGGCGKNLTMPPYNPTAYAHVKVN